MDSVVTCRTLPWGSCPSSSQGSLRFFDDFDYRASLVDSGGSCVHVQVNLSALFPAVPLLCRRLRFNVLYHSGPIEWTLGGVQGIFKNHSAYDSACDKRDGKFTQLVLFVQGQGRCMRREETICGHPVLLVSVWPVPAPVPALLSTSQVW